MIPLVHGITHLILPIVAFSSWNPEIVAATAPNERFRFTLEESKTIRGYPDKPAIHKLNDQTFVRRVGSVAYVVRKSAPELQEVAAAYKLIAQVVQHDAREPLTVGELESESRIYLQEIIAQEMRVDAKEVNMWLTGELEMLPRQFVTFTSKDFGEFTVIASPDIDAMNESDRKEYLQSRVQNLRKTFDRTTQQESKAKSLPCAQIALSDTNLLVRSFSQYRGYQVQMNALETGKTDASQVTRTLYETVKESKEIFRAELRRQSTELYQRLNRIDKFRFPNGQAGIPSEREIARFRETLKFNLEQNRVEAKQIDRILQQSAFKEIGIGLVLFIQVRLPNGTSEQLTPAINF